MADIAVVDYGMGNLRSVAQALRAVASDASIVVSDDPNEIALAGRVVFPGQGAMPDCMRELDGRGLRAAVLQAARNKPFLGICIGLQMLFEHSAEGDVPGLGVLRGEVVRFAAPLSDEQGNRMKVPHMGWNQVRQIASHRPLPEGEGTIALSPSGRKLDRGGVDPQPPPGAETVAPSDKTTSHSTRPSKDDAQVAGYPAGGGGLGRGFVANHPLWQNIAQDARFYFVHSYYVQPQDENLVQATSCYPQPFVCAVARDNLFAVQFHPEKSQQAGLTLLRNFVNWNPV